MIESLSIYILGILLIYYASVVNQTSFAAGKILISAALMLIGSIAIFRGNVGTDTTAYESIVRSLRETGDGAGIEPGFILLINAINLTGFSEVVVVRALSMAYVLTLTAYVVKADRRELTILSLYFVPSFFYTYSMNAIRIGLALNVLLLSVQGMRRGGQLAPNITAVLSLAFHYSVLLPYVYAIWTRHNIDAKKTAALATIALVALIPILYLQKNYIYSKILLYGDMASPSALSGLSYLISVLVLFLGVLASGVPNKDKIYLVFSGASLMAFAIFISRFTYAGLRIVELIATIYPFIIAIVYTKLRKEFDNAIKLALFVAGLINAIFLLRRFLTYPGVGSSPWLPYEALF